MEIKSLEGLKIRYFLSLNNLTIFSGEQSIYMKEKTLLTESSTNTSKFTLIFPHKNNISLKAVILSSILYFHPRQPVFSGFNQTYLQPSL